MKKYITTFVLATTMLLASCESLVSNMNDDLNNPTDAPAELMFTGVELAVASVHEGYNSLLSSIWSGYYFGYDRQWADFHVYNVAGSYFDGMWSSSYYGIHRNARLLLAKIEPQGIKVLAGMTKVLMAHNMGTMTALYGDIPFSQAAQLEEFPNAKYDSQVDVYKGVQTLLDEAIKDLETGVGVPRAGTDVLLGGDPKKWIEVAYTLKARFYTDTKEYALAATAAAKGVSRAANSMYMPHGTILNQNQNFIYSFLAVSRIGDAAAATKTGEPCYLVKLTDPTLTATYRGNAKTDETARFNFYFLRQGVNVPNRIEPNTQKRATQVGFMSVDAAFPLVTFQENKLTQAEMAIRAGNFANALTFLNEHRAFLNTGGGYINSVTAANFTYKYLPYEENDFEAGGIENADKIAKNDALLREILEERYVTFYCQTIGWNDERRNRASAVGIKLTPNAGTRLPSRFIYSQNEINGNPLAPKPVPGVFDAMAIYK
ncbi:SusD/RagB family nutrient-binding outer membrane lipoprotein [Runella sp. SP2]|uniref:SusD/RagB family nutrient-binding outer membrane lipoprotein n=1 Tax=Runella sp. SP2 TaxID=2268026 RepID=UPI000F07AE0A|nr:SusD/RagB family nutrient-binding outer membrane lipoprotein [Runella sp. SP2]AYQ35711.1 SusD/RagB family nutrient-binding outer membrane lipoprotein [Runella sp. SP2]